MNSHVAFSQAFGSLRSKWLILSATLLMTAGCASNGVESANIIAADNVNQQLAVSVDLVYILDKALADSVAAMTARQWFQDKSQLALLHPNSMLIISQELVPYSQLLFELKFESRSFQRRARRASAVLLFANYLTESNAYTLNISEFKEVIIRLDETTISAEEK